MIYIPYFIKTKTILANKRPIKKADLRSYSSIIMAELWSVKPLRKHGNSLTKYEQRTIYLSRSYGTFLYVWEIFDMRQQRIFPESIKLDLPSILKGTYTRIETMFAVLQDCVTI